MRAFFSDVFLFRCRARADEVVWVPQIPVSGEARGGSVSGLRFSVVLSAGRERRVFER